MWIGIRGWLWIRIRLAFCVLAALAGCRGASDEKPRPLRLGTNVWVGYEPLYVAREQKLYKGNPVRLVEFSSATQVLSAFRSGAIDAATLTLDEAVLLQDAGFPIRLVLVFDYSYGGDVLLAKPYIESVAELRGKLIAVEDTALGSYTLALALKKGGLSRADVMVQTVEVDSHEQVFASDEVDAVVTFEPVRTRLLAQGAKTLFSSREVPGKIIDVLVVSEKAATVHEKHLDAVLDGYFLALSKAANRDQSTLAIMGQRMHLAPAQVEVALEGIRSPNRAEAQEFLSGTDISTAVQDVVSFMIESELLAEGTQIQLRSWRAGADQGETSP